jgi:hypothetical protein
MTSMKRLVGWLAGVVATIATLLAIIGHGPAGAVVGTPVPSASSTPSPVPAPPASTSIVITPHGTICWELLPPNCPCEMTALLSGPANGPVTFLMSTMDGSAMARNRDYVPIDRVRVTIPAGATSVRIPIRILPDDVRETDEYFFVVISSVTGAQVVTDRAQVIIKDGAQPPR